MTAHDQHDYSKDDEEQDMASTGEELGSWQEADAVHIDNVGEGQTCPHYQSRVPSLKTIVRPVQDDHCLDLTRDEVR
jgi:hypothetical protein